ncbi:unnamed protein product [Onchocerca flexuosa]|nr:unnamed protein product [Onchocerca flexuosa]
MMTCGHRYRCPLRNLFCYQIIIGILSCSCLSLIIKDWQFQIANIGALLNSKEGRKRRSSSSEELRRDYSIVSTNGQQQQDDVTDTPIICSTPETEAFRHVYPVIDADS